MTPAFLTLTKGQGHTTRSKITDVEVSAFSECFLLSLCALFSLFVCLLAYVRMTDFAQLVICLFSCMCDASFLFVCVYTVTALAHLVIECLY